MAANQHHQTWSRSESFNQLISNLQPQSHQNAAPRQNSHEITTKTKNNTNKSLENHQTNKRQSQEISKIIKHHFANREQFPSPAPLPSHYIDAYDITCLTYELCHSSPLKPGQFTNPEVKQWPMNKGLSLSFMARVFDLMLKCPTKLPINPI